MSNSIVLCAITFVNNVESESSGHVDSTTCRTLNLLMLIGWVFVRKFYTYV